MLSRTASDLFWMSRYLERAENLARMLEVSYSLSLMPQDGRGDGLDEIAMPLLITGTLETYVERHGDLHAERMLHFFALDASNPASIYSCLGAARASAHAVRGRITADMWENINSTWLEIRGIAQQGLTRYGMSRFCEWVKERSHLFRGATYGTIMRNDAFRFIRLGTFIERADNTMRMLDARYEMLELRGPQANAAADSSAAGYYQWSALLRALSSFELTPKSIGTPPAPVRWPSFCCCVPTYRARCAPAWKRWMSFSPQRMAAEMDARLRYTSIDEILDEGLHEWLNEFIPMLAQLGDAIHISYLEAA